MSSAATKLSLPIDPCSTEPLQEIVTLEEENETNPNTGSDSDEQDSSSTGRKYDAPAQDKFNIELSDIEKRLVALNEARNLGIGEENVANVTKQIKQWTEKKKKIVSQINLRKAWQKAAKKKRDKQKKNWEKAVQDFPSIANNLKIRDSVGRPPVEEVYPNLHADILNIATIGAAASEKRREDLFRTVKTLDQLHSSLSDLGYKLSRQTAYLRLLPKGSASNQLKKHVRTVPVRLVRPENNLRRKHPDRSFAAESYNSAFKIAEVMGPSACVATSFDDKSSVHIGVTAAKRQGAMLMNMQYRVRLPDHDFNVGSRHLLVPSVVGINRINENGKVGYTGETYIFLFYF